MLIAGSFVGYVAGAWLADRIGRRKLFITFAILASVLVIAYTRLPLSNEVMLFLGFPLGFCASAYFSGVGAFLTELFPTRLRRSEEHTSELQSLMRISYAVFCLKKKKPTKIKTLHQHYYS